MIELLSVNVSGPKVLLVHQNKPIWSSIGKQPVEAGELYLSPTNLVGDQQTDTRVIKGHQVHGGHDQALYAYPSEHYESFGAGLQPGALGENLTIRGITEDKACIGDVWRWGEATVQVTLPRSPCYKFGIHRGDEAVRLMKDTGYSGWYLSVREPGTVPARGEIEVVERHPAGVTVREVFRAINNEVAPRLDLLRSLDVLPEKVKRWLEK